MIHPMWWWIFDRMRGGIGTGCQTRVESSPQEARRTCLAGSIVRVGRSSHHSSRTGQGPQSWLFCPIMSLAFCGGACTRCDTVLRAAQCGPTGTPTMLDDTRSRNCGFFSQPFSVTPVSCCSVGLDSVRMWLATQCEQFASGPHQGSVAEVPSHMQGRESRGQSSIAISECKPESR